MKKGLLYVGILFLVLFMSQGQPIVAQADEAFQITAYTVTVTVSQENVCHIREDIQVSFSQSRHGLYRNIPLTYTISREDGTKNRVHSKVDNIDCNAQFSTGRNNGNLQIKIGNPNVTVSGEQSYSLSYDYHLGKDPLKGKDEFYLNLIGTEWDTMINNVKFSVLMPSAIDQEKLGMSYGYQGAVSTEGLQYTVQDNMLTGFLDPSITLMPEQGITLRMELPDGYFVYHPEFPTEAVGSILLAVIAMFVSFLLWKYYGKDDPVVEVIEFHPPAALNSLETALAYKGQVDGEDVVSLIVYLAQKGYIEISESGKNNFILRKLREYDGTNFCEQLFMNELFAKLPVVEKSALKNKFYKTVNKITKIMNCKRNQRMLFFESSMNKNWIFYILAVFSNVLAFYNPLVESGSSPYNAILTPGMLGAVFVSMLRMLFQPGKLINRLYMIVWGIIFFSVWGIMLFQSVLYADLSHQAACVICMIATVVIMFFLNFMPRRTEYGNKILGYIKGFKEFLETAEKDRLEALVEEDPQYFYEILPYTYVLGVSDKWMNKFEEIALEPPTWYHSPHSSFHMASFHRELRQTMKSANATMTSSPGGSHGSGGGHSGGGHGGGGGGSW